MPSIVFIDELNDAVPTMLVDAIRCNVAIACVCDIVDCFVYCHNLILNNLILYYLYRHCSINSLACLVQTHYFLRIRASIFTPLVGGGPPGPLAPHRWGFR